MQHIYKFLKTSVLNSFDLYIYLHLPFYTFFCYTFRVELNFETKKKKSMQYLEMNECEVC